MPNKTFGQIIGSIPYDKAEKAKPVKTSGKLWDWCQAELKPLGLHIDNTTPYSLGVYRKGTLIGNYNTLSEIKTAIIKGYVQDKWNL